MKIGPRFAEVIMKIQVAHFSWDTVHRLARKKYQPSRLQSKDFTKTYVLHFYDATTDSS